MENTKIREYAERLFQRFPELRSSSESIFNAYSIIENSFFKSGMIFICGNGGSAADAEHIVGELSKGFLLKRELPEQLRREMNEKLGENMDDITGKLQMGLKAMVLSTHQSLSQLLPMMWILSSVMHSSCLLWDQKTIVSWELPHPEMRKIF